jgi:cell fate regulator YaaT (PSP1 superfamily)
MRDTDCQPRYLEFRLREEHLRLVGCCLDAEVQVGDGYRVVFNARERFCEVSRVDFPIDEKSRFHLPCRVVGRIGGDDYCRMAHAAHLERRARRLFAELVGRLPLKLVDVSAEVDGELVTFFFTTPQKVDYRRLVAMLARRLGTRIEMRQIGVRDEARRLGGFATCGRELCCATWLHGFDPVTIKMAKQQDLVLNPSRISGLCGRLMCCLAYEHEFYVEFKRRLPRMGSRVSLKDGRRGRLIRAEPLKASVVVKLDSGDSVEVEEEQLVKGDK